MKNKWVTGVGLVLALATGSSVAEQGSGAVADADRFVALGQLSSITAMTREQLADIQGAALVDINISPQISLGANNVCIACNNIGVITQSNLAIGGGAFQSNFGAVFGQTN